MCASAHSLTISAKLGKTDASISSCFSISGWGQFIKTLQVTVLWYECVLPLIKFCVTFFMQVVEGRYDVLVITVGALISQMKEKRSLTLEMFHTIVMDECHHARGGSDFNTLLGMVIFADTVPS